MITIWVNSYLSQTVILSPTEYVSVRYTSHTSWQKQHLPLYFIYVIFFREIFNIRYFIGWDSSANGTKLCTCGLYTALGQTEVLFSTHNSHWKLVFQFPSGHAEAITSLGHPSSRGKHLEGRKDLSHWRLLCIADVAFNMESSGSHWDK